MLLCGKLWATRGLMVPALLYETDLRHSSPVKGCEPLVERVSSCTGQRSHLPSVKTGSVLITAPTRRVQCLWCTTHSTVLLATMLICGCSLLSTYHIVLTHCTVLIMVLMCGAHCTVVITQCLTHGAHSVVFSPLSVQYLSHSAHHTMLTCGAHCTKLITQCSSHGAHPMVPTVWYSVYSTYHTVLITQCSAQYSQCGAHCTVLTIQYSLHSAQPRP